MLKWTKQHQHQLQTILDAQDHQFVKSIDGLHKINTRKRYSTGNFIESTSTPTTHARMPTTLTHTLERHLNHRRSLDNQLEERRMRTSLTGLENKENFGVHFVRSPFGNTNISALQDLSNGMSPKRLQAVDSRRRQVLGGRPQQQQPLTPNRLSRFSDDFAEPGDVTPLSRMRFRNLMREDSLSSSRMGDVTLDRMLDAIIESARKDVKVVKPVAMASSSPSPSKLYEEVDNTTLYGGDGCDEPSIHEMEVRTPTHLKRQRVVRRKNPRPSERSAPKVGQQQRPKQPPKSPQLIGLTLPNGIPSPETPVLQHKSLRSQFLGMDTPPRQSVDAYPLDCEYSDNSSEMQRCSTPTLSEAQSIKRCLSFSSDDADEEIDYSAAKRGSVASSCASSTGDYCYSGRSSRSSQNSSKLASLKGCLDLSIFVENQKLNVHVIRCRDLQRSNGSTSLNAYVKVALIRKPPSARPHQQQQAQAQVRAGKASESNFQRTAVHRHSSRPYFDHHFKFDVADLPEVADDSDRLQLAVWHRDRQLKRSEFLGCMSFPLQSLLQQPINGSYRLQSQSCLNNPQPAVPVQPHGTASTAAAAAGAHPPPPPPPPPQPQQQRNQQQQAPTTTPTNCVGPANVLSATTNDDETTSMATLTRQKSDDDVISIDSMAQTGQTGLAGDSDHPMVLSKKALHQRDADENLFLRFLELDPPPGEAAPVTATGSGSAGSVPPPSATATPPVSRAASAAKPIGRTPFTMTKKLLRTTERGFGFSIVWTHPPRVEKIEPGLSADRCGILPGDYVIFVDKHNVVTMPEADVLNLIRSQGSALTLEIFRRPGSGLAGAATASAASVTLGQMPAAAAALSVTGRSNATTAVMNGKASSLNASDDLQSTTTTTAIMGAATMAPTATATAATPRTMPGPLPLRPSTACSGTSSIEAAKRRLNLPQVTFSKESIVPVTDNRRRILFQLISREQNFISALHFGLQRYVQPLVERKDLISPNDHRTLFQNIDELQRISEDILEQLCNDDQEPQMNFVSRVYLSKTTAICAAYKKYCNGIKRADCVLVNKSRQTGSEFVAFITEPPVPRKCPDLTMFIHRPLQHFREILKLMQLLASNCHVDTEEHKNFNTVINELQAAYREITVSSGLMEPLGEGRPLLTLQDLESRMVFTKCKPFTLAVQGRQWIFGGDLSRVEGRSVKPYWTLLFSDIIVFAKVSRDRVLFITEEPVPIANIVDSCFHMRKKTTEFRLTVDPNGRLAESPTGYCAPDLSRTPKKGSRRKSLILRAPSLELKAVWQNLLQRQIFLVNAALGSTPLSSPLDSPDVLNTIVPLSDIGIASHSIGSIKLSSMDSINLKNQQQNHRLANPSDRLDMLIDEKCRILNKTGTPKSSALHLANWMKGQLDKQQEQARQAAIRTGDGMANGDEQGFHDADTEPDERITYWTRQQLEKRTKELNLAKENGLRAKANFAGKRLSGVDELSMSDAYSEAVSQISQSHSTTSDSQITVRSSPIVLDKIPVCRHCHKNCQQSQGGGPPAKPPRASAVAAAKAGDPSAPGVLCNSLKVQHSQASPNRCCSNKLNGGSVTSRPGSVSSMSSSTITGEQPSDRSSKVVASSSKRETGDTESDVAQLITDDLSQSEATTDDSVGGIPTSSSSGLDEAQRKLTDSLSKLRILEERVVGGHAGGMAAAREVFMNGSGSDVPADERSSARPKENGVTEARPKPQPPPRRVRVSLQNASESTRPSEVNQKASVTSATTETAKIVRSAAATAVHTTTTTATTPKKSPLKSPKTPTNQFVACNCECKPADFENATLSPDELQQQTCKMIESPKQSPKMPRNHKSPSSEDKEKEAKTHEDPHKNCKCVCDKRPRGRASEADDDDDNLSLMLIGLAQFSPAAKFFNMKVNATPSGPPTTTTPSTGDPLKGSEAGFVPTIAVVPPTPEAILTKTTTNVWDNSASSYAGGHTMSASATATTVTTTISAKLQINSVTPRQAVIENIPDDSCDESPLDEEPPYRPMNNALRRYGTMSSLEKLPSDERNDEADLDTEQDPDAEQSHPTAVGDEVADLDEDDEDEDENDDDNARADNIDGPMKKTTTTIKRFAHNEAGLGGEAEDGEAGSSAMNGSWSAGRSAKMSFFEESRAFIDKYLGRWNQDTVPMQPLTTSDIEEQMDECTSGATSGEEVWGTPTSGGDNDDMHLVNSENTHSSPTKSSNSLNDDDDDDTELMMDELLMAPPMTASTIRGLLPRRRLEPLFEEETESDEEKTQQESEELKKGETTTNGHYLEDLVGSSSETEDTEEEEDDLRYLEDLDLEDEPTSITADDRQSPRHLPQTGSMGTRPLRAQPPGVLIPVAVLKASSCEYLLEQRSAVALETITSCSSSLPETTTTFSDCTVSGPMAPTTAAAASPILVEMKTTTTTMRSTTMTMMTTLRSPARSSTTTTTSSASGTTSSASYSASTATSTPAPCPSGQRPAAKFIPPPPPPRRLLLTQTNLKTSASSAPKPSRPPGKSGASADDGSSGGVAAVTEATTSQPPPPPSPPRAAPKASMAAYNIGGCGGDVAADAKRPSSTIIETSLLGSVGPGPTSQSSTTASRTTGTSRTAVGPPMSCSTPRTATASRQGGGAEADSDAAPAGPGFGLSPRLEMRLALNHDILGDEDLICYDPGPDLTTILGHDLSTFHRRTGRDLLNRSANHRVQPKEAVISFSQQRNSKIDTPTVNRRPRPAVPSSQSSPQSCRIGLGGSPRVAGAPPPLHPNRNTWSSSASVDRSDGETARGAAISKGYSFSSDESKLGDLEILARREKIYCMSQSRSGLPVRTMTTAMAPASSASTRSKDSWSPPLMRATSTTSMGDRSDTSASTKRTRKIGRDETALMESGKSNRLIDFIKRRNSEIPSPTLTNCSQSSLSDSNPSSTPLHKQLQMSPRKDNDKPSLNRRLWKQIKKRRRSNSVSEVVAS